jgi:excisionase family DNA binding protein
MIETTGSALLTVSDVARRLGISTSRVRQLGHSGELRPLRTLAGWRVYDEAQVERLALERDRTGRTRRQ